MGLALVAGALPATAADAPRLNALLKAARVAVRAHVANVNEYDNGRIAMASLRVDEALKGAPSKDATINVVEMRDLPTPPVFEAGHDVVAFLVSYTRNSYLAQYLPPGDYMSLVKVKPGCLTARSADDAASMAQLIGRMVSSSQQPEHDAARRASAARRLGFDLIAASHPVLVEDGTTTIAGIEDLAGSLTSAEQQAIETALDRSDLPARLRIALIQTVADRGLEQLVPALRRLESAELADAAWAALAKLGAAPAREDLEKHLTSTEPRMRTAAIQQLLRQEKAAAIPRAIQIARTDPDTDVRVAATEAIGASGGPEAVSALQTVYAEPTWETRQAVGRSLLRIGGRPAAAACEHMAFTAPVDAQRYAVVLLLLSVQRDDPLVQRVINTHPDEELRRLAAHGLDVHEH